MIINAAQKHKRPYRQNLSVRKGAFFAFIFSFYVIMPFVFKFNDPITFQQSQKFNEH
jgi:hypothetical protein